MITYLIQQDKYFYRCTVCGKLLHAHDMDTVPRTCTGCQSPVKAAQHLTGALQAPPPSFEETRATIKALMREIEGERG